MIENLKRLLNPRSIVVIGGTEGEKVIEQCLKLGFSGKIWAVNPQRDSLAGIKCFSSVTQLPSIPDAAFIAIPPESAINDIQALSDMGAGGAVCYTSGFAEHSPQGQAMQNRLVSASSNFATIGPNCYGFLNYLDGVALWPDLHGLKRVDRGAAVIMQSGNIALSLSFNDRSTPISHLITIGNRAVIDAHHLIITLLDDARVTAIGLYIEAITNVNAFIKACHIAFEKNVPIIVIKSGKSESGSNLTLSHTSSFAGEHRLYTAMFERIGIICIDSLTEFMETLKLLALSHPIRGNKFMSLSCSGGEAALVADATSESSLSMPFPSNESQRKLSEILGENVHISNPLDYHTYIWGDFDKQKQCFKAVLDDGYDCVALVIDYPNIDDRSIISWEVTERALISAKESSHTSVVVISTLPESLPETVRDRLIHAGITPLQGLNDGLKAIAHSVNIATKISHVSNEPFLIKQHYLDDIRSVQLNEFDSKTWLKDAGLTTPNSYICTSKNAVFFAEKSGYPVVLKIHSDKIGHKSDYGGVRLNISNANQLNTAVEEMTALSDVFLLEKMITSAVAEMIVGIKHDQLFGQVLVIGFGGVFVELLQDTRTLLLPTNKEEVKKAIESLQCFPMLSGYRNRPKGDIEALVCAITKITEHVDSHPIFELDINPLLVLSEGNGVVAVDALIKRPIPQNQP